MEETYPDQSPTEDNIGAGTRRFFIARQQLKWSAMSANGTSARKEKDSRTEWFWKREWPK